jgi:tetratricopeptide (TPR) repeat protein
MLRFVVAFAISLAVAGPSVLGGPREDCNSTDDLDRIISGCTARIRENPRNAAAYNNRGLAYADKGDYDRAIADHSKSIEMNRNDDKAYSNRGIAYRLKGDLERAKADYSKAIEINPKNEKPRYNRAIAYEAKGELHRAIADYSKAIEINARSANAYSGRGGAYGTKGDYDRAVADYSKAIEVNPKSGTAYYGRGVGHMRKGDNELAIADLTKAVEIDPRYGTAYAARGYAYSQMGDYDRAIADITIGIGIDPKDANLLGTRAWVYHLKADNDRAIADATKAVELNPTNARVLTMRGRALLASDDLDRAASDLLQGSQLDPKLAGARLGLGRVYLRKGDHDRALAELSEAMRLDTKDPEIFVERAAAYEAKGQIDRAVVDYQAAIALKARSETECRAITEARVRLVAIERQKQLPAPQQPKVIEALAAAPAQPASPGRRVALVMANSNYGSMGRLANPGNDGRAIAASLRRLGFAEVIERYDLGHAAMGSALKDFGDRTAEADWAVVYFAGHGIELNGTAYLMPIDAKLERDAHVTDETVPLHRVQEKVETARKLRLVILDACRNNPFIPRMVRSAGATRSIGRGLAQIEPEGGVLVVYSAKHGTFAEDGTAGALSPFAEALLSHLEEPGLEINFLFRRVRDQVMTKTGRRQEPYLYGSLPGESLFFKHAGAR